MRQALLVIVLIGAAFGGGAVVSGPGFRWAQEHALDYMGLKDGGEIDTLELIPPPGEGKPAVAEPLAGPAAAKSALSQAASQPPSPAPAPEATEPYTEAQAAAPAPSPPPPAGEPAKPEGPALLGALNAMLSPPAAAESKPEATPPADAAVSPSNLPPLEAVPSPEPPPPPSSAPATGEWAEIRRKLDAAGVSRYTIEGTPGGPVTFACLIPIAGRQAVSQRFEAEGDDEIQAAQAVLKRINLWRASHAEPEKS